MLNKNTLFGRNAETSPREPAAPALRTAPPPGHVTTAPAGGSVRADAPAREPSLVGSEPGGSKLIVGPDIKLKGVEITDCDTLVVEGRVEATMDSRVIQIAENGAYVGTVGIDIAEIRGHFEGELTARKRLVIHASGSVSGTIRYGGIVVEEGGKLSGDVRMLDPASVKPMAAAAPAGAGSSSTEDESADLRGVAEAISERSRSVMMRGAQRR